MNAQIRDGNAVDEVISWFYTLSDESREILIAEDDAVSRRVLEATLCVYGFRVIAATDGEAACRALEVEAPPPLAILDVSMPGRDGLEICRWIRSSPRLKHTYVILLTTRSSTMDVISGLQAGADDYITKPYDQAELRARIRVGMRMLALQKELVAKHVCANCGGAPIA